MGPNATTIAIRVAGGERLASIFLNTQFYCILTGSRLKSKTSCWVHFAAASTLLHEIARVAMIMARPKGHYYVGHDSPVSEDGFAAEAFLFGGIPIINLREIHERAYAETWDDAADAVVRQKLCVWPNETHAQLYRSKNDSIGIRGPIITAGLEGHRMDQKWVESLFKETFWVEKVGKKGLKALQPHGILGRHRERLVNSTQGVVADTPKE
jgi:hypothetical protein